jgi:hypothetical protein
MARDSSLRMMATTGLMLLWLFFVSVDAGSASERDFTNRVLFSFTYSEVDAKKAKEAHS